jgi:hypothetical protein
MLGAEETNAVRSFFLSSRGSSIESCCHPLLPSEDQLVSEIRREPRQLARPVVKPVRRRVHEP